MNRSLLIDTKLKGNHYGKEKQPITPCQVIGDSEQPISGSLKDLHCLRHSPYKSPQSNL